MKHNKKKNGGKFKLFTQASEPMKGSKKKGKPFGGKKAKPYKR